MKDSSEFVFEQHGNPYNGRRISKAVSDALFSALEIAGILDKVKPTIRVIGTARGRSSRGACHCHGVTTGNTANITLALCSGSADWQFDLIPTNGAMATDLQQALNANHNPETQMTVPVEPVTAVPEQLPPKTKEVALEKLRDLIGLLYIAGCRHDHSISKMCVMTVISDKLGFTPKHRRTTTVLVQLKKLYLEGDNGSYCFRSEAVCRKAAFIAGREFEEAKESVSSPPTESPATVTRRSDSVHISDAAREKAAASLDQTKQPVFIGQAAEVIDEAIAEATTRFNGLVKTQEQLTKTMSDLEEEKVLHSRNLDLLEALIRCLEEMKKIS